MPELTDKDRALLALLRDNARLTTTALASHLGVSRATVQARLKRLEDTGVITGYHAALGPGTGIQDIRSLVLITHAPKVVEKILMALSKIQTVKAVHSVSGSVDLIADVVTDTVAALDKTIDQIGQIEGVEKTNSQIILSTRLAR